MPSPRARLGTQGEAVCAAHLERAGLRVIERNYRCRYGEIDLIAEDGDTLVFAEVKTRRTVSHGTPEESVTPRKAKRLALTALHYLQARGQEQRPWRLDLVAITLAANGPAAITYVRGIEPPTLD